MSLRKRLQQVTGSPRRTDNGTPTSPNLGGGTTDPSMWAALQQQPVDLNAYRRAQPFDVDRAVAGWVTQIRRDRTSTSMLRYATEQPGMTDIYLDMKDFGNVIRRQAGTFLNARPNHQQAFDPSRELNHSPGSVIRAVCALYQINLHEMDEPLKLLAIKHSTEGSPAYAIMQTSGGAAPPMLVYNEYPHGKDDGPWADPKLDNYLWQRNNATWAFYCGCCLAYYLYNLKLYGGRGGIAEVIAPFDPRYHAAMMPLCHVFSKALLGFKPLCPQRWPCACNNIEQILDEVPADKPWQTGVLPQGVARDSVQAQLHRPYRNSADMPANPGAFGAYAAPSQQILQMTPPMGISDIRRRAWGREHQTDPRGWGR